MANGYYERVEEATAFLHDRLGDLPEVAVVLGSGLGDFADRLAGGVSVPYGEIPHWPASAVVGHAGRLVSGALGGRRVLVLSGRVHYYEGHAMAVVTFAMRVLGRLGVKVVILTNAAGGINLEFEPGTLMVIDDHINLMGGNPLIGPHEERFGPRFPDMTEVYAARLRALVHEVGCASGIKIQRGIYAALHGPSYETPAEIRFLRIIGADAVGMSTAPEAIVARHMGIEVLGISCITNPAAGVLPSPLLHEEVMEVARRVREDFSRLLEGVIERL